MLSTCCNAPTTELSDEFDSEEIIGNTNLVVCDECKNFVPKTVDQCFCKSYSDDNHIIQDCTCGKCAKPEPKTEESLEKICSDFFDAYDSVRYTREVGVMNKCFIEVCERFLKELEEHKKLIQKHYDLVLVIDKFSNIPSLSK